ncbi:hypothetical protein V5O48_009774 [Marasmius crinis-equi]|uniref:Carboxylic ester hydrolase n=1 Tax=Marasmius crinis-equi TaxID=585013 RepID=A0ABR3FA60_9AGAR
MGRTIIFQLLACTFFSAVCSNPIVDLGYAQYQGVFDPNLNVTNYRGVRYAAAPTGDLRWREPKPPGNVSEVQQANTDPPSCYQSQGGGGALGVAPGEVEAESEDCLFLNVAVPGSRIPSDGDLPVVVWIPGGGYIYGNASQFQASDLVKDSQNSVVSVVMQYRLGLFGFLAGNEVKENGALNIGLLDQQFALRWVREHVRLVIFLFSRFSNSPPASQISKFGGDPTKVTIWGESSGGGSVLEHIVAEDGQTNPGLFRSGISVSTFLYSHYEYNDEIPEGMYNEVLSQTNCSSSPDHFSCLRAVDAKVLATINNNINTAKFFLTSAFLPVIDGTFLTQRVTQALKQGKLNGEALLTVALTNEGVRFVNQSASVNASRVARELFPKFESKEAAAVAKQYEGLGTEVEQATLVLGESTFVCPTYFLTEAFGDRAFKGQFAIPPSLHTDDLRYYFPNSAI